MVQRLILFLALLVPTVFLRPVLGEEKNPLVPVEGLVRIASGVSGHIHPAACVAKSGTVVVIYGKADMKDLHVSRSTDGGRTWSKPVQEPRTEKLSIYPGSLTALSDGRILHVWNVW